MIRKIVTCAALLATSSLTFAAEFQGYVRGVYLNSDGLMQLYMSSDTQSLPQCDGVFDTEGFRFTVTAENAHIAQQWMTMLESARQAKMALEGASVLPHPASDPSLVKVGYDEVNGKCDLDYVYYLHWYNL